MMRRRYSRGHILNNAVTNKSQMVREEKADKEIETTIATKFDGANANPVNEKRPKSHSRSRSRRRTVTDTGQTTSYDDERTPVAVLSHYKEEPQNHKEAKASDLVSSPPSIHLISDNENFTERADGPTTNRPTLGGVAYPFKLGTHLRDDNTNASTITLKSQVGISTPKNELLPDDVASTARVGLGSEAVRASIEVNPQDRNTEQAESLDNQAKRPEVERFVTASEGL